MTERMVESSHGANTTMLCCTNASPAINGANMVLLGPKKNLLSLFLCVGGLMVVWLRYGRGEVAALYVALQVHNAHR